MTKVCILTSKAKDDVRLYSKESMTLIKAGYEVHYVCPNTDDGFHNGIFYHGINYKFGSNLKRFITLSKLLVETALKVDADIYSFNDPAVLPYVDKFKKRGKKIIFDVLEDHPSLLKVRRGWPSFMSNMLSWFYEKYEAHQVKKCDGVFVCYHWTKDRLSHYCKNIELVFNFPLLKERNLALTERESLSGKEIVILCYAGTISKEWNIHTVIKATEHFSNVRFLLAGWCSDGLLNELKSLSGWKNVDYIGRVNKDEVIEKVYDKADIGVAFYHYCPLCRGSIGNLSNNKLFEYMYAGLPIVCTDYKLWGEIIDKYNLGETATPDSVDSIVGAIKKIITEKDNVYGKRGIEAVTNEYNWNAQESQVLKVYNNL